VDNLAISSPSQERRYSSGLLDYVMPLATADGTGNDSKISIRKYSKKEDEIAELDEWFESGAVEIV
jgi:hypothetical protein